MEEKKKSCHPELASNSRLLQTRRLFLSALTLALTSSPALLSSLTVLGEEEEEEEEETFGHLHTIISEPVKPRPGEYLLLLPLRLNTCNHSSRRQCFFDFFFLGWFPPASESRSPRSKGTMQLCSMRSSHLFSSAPCFFFSSSSSFFPTSLVQSQSREAKPAWHRVRFRGDGCAAPDAADDFADAPQTLPAGRCAGPFSLP